MDVMTSDFRLPEPSAPTWRRHKRPQSMMALQFSAALDDLFKIDNGLDSLVSTVEDKRRSVFVQNRELEELQEQIRAAEARLRGNDDVATALESQPSQSPVESSLSEPSIFATMPSTQPEPAAAVQAIQPLERKKEVALLTPYDYVMVPRMRARRRRRRLADLVAELEEEDETEEATGSEESGSSVGSEATDSGTDSTADSS